MSTTEDTVFRFLDHLSRNGRVATSAKLAGISPETAWSWLHRSRAGTAFTSITYGSRTLPPR